MAAANEGVDTMSAFQANMRTLLQEGTCSDVTLQVGGDSASAQQEVTLIKAHSNVLCAHSPVFALELASTWKDRVAASVSGVATVADVKVPYTLAATKVALDFCYSGAVEIPAGEVVEVLDLARHYKISVLADAAAAIIKEQMNATNVCIFYSNAVQFNHEQLSTECADFCEKNLGQILEQETFTTLPEVVVKQLVASDDAKAEEIAIFKALVAWGKALYGEDGAGSAEGEEGAAAAAKPPPASPAAHPDDRPAGASDAASLRERLAPMFEHVRFPLIDGKALAEHVEPTGLVEDHLLFEAYRYHASGVAKEGCGAPPTHLPAHCRRALLTLSPVGASAVRAAQWRRSRGCQDGGSAGACSGGAGGESRAAVAVGALDPQRPVPPRGRGRPPCQADQRQHEGVTSG